jgi:light-regulated signal transduction histidine kinase (bacteriophytochrome)
VEVVIAPGLSARGDRSLLRLVMDNLIGNAWKFTGLTQGARIEVGGVIVDGRSAFFVRDNGAGFDMAYAHKLFAPFQRLHSAAEFEGTGIGLAMVQRIVHRHGGSVRAEGAVGRGATFTLTLD